MSDGRIEKRFDVLAKASRAGLVTFITAGDPDQDTSLNILKSLPDAGADFIEIGIPFSDPMADGPVIEAASVRALKAGMTLKKVLDLVETFRATDNETPIILMGYFNPVYAFGVEKFVKAAKTVGVDGLIIVDVPPEADEELCLPAQNEDLRFIRLIAPTTDENRLPVILRNTSGFLYYVSVTGITGAKSASIESIDKACKRIRRHTNLPVVAGFGVKSQADVREVAKYADAVVVGSAIIDVLANTLDKEDRATVETIQKVLDFVAQLALGITESPS